AAMFRPANGDVAASASLDAPRENWSQKDLSTRACRWYQFTAWNAARGPGPPLALLRYHWIFSKIRRSRSPFLGLMLSTKVTRPRRWARKSAWPSRFSRWGP